MKRIVSVVLLIAMMLSICMPLAGCVSEGNGSLTMGVWLSMINQEFGMDTYVEQKPYFADINKDSPYFGTVQAAAEWGIIDASQKLDLAKKLTWKEALLTLVNAGGFVSSTATADEKISYAIEHFDPSIRTYWMNRVISGSKATALLATAQHQWANKTYDVAVNEYTYAEGVTDLTADSEELVFDISGDGIVRIPVSEGIELEAGEVYLLPLENESGDVTAFRAEEITTDGEYIYIKNSEEELEIGDVYEELLVQETVEADMENVTIYDGNGNIISVGESVVAQNAIMSDQGYITNLAMMGDGDSVTVVDLAAGKVKHSFKIDDVEISFEYQLNGAFDFKVGVDFPNMLSAKYQKEHPSQELKFTVGAAIKNLKATHDVDYSVFSGLKSASLRVDYTTEFEGTLEFSGKPVEKLYAPAKQNYTCKDWQDTFAKNWANSVWKDADGENAKGAKTIKIASVTIKSLGVASICLDISYEISASGSIGVKITETGSKGLEYNNKKLRSIKTSDKDIDVSIKGKVESVVAVGPMLYALGLKKAILGASVSVGFGAEIGLTMHVADSEGHLLSETSLPQMQGEIAGMFANAGTEVAAELITEIAAAQGCTYESETSGNVQAHFDVCFDGSIYFILRIGLAKNTYADDILKGSVKVEWEIFGSKNAKLVHVHCCNGDWQFGRIGKDNVKCKLEYTPFIKAEEPPEETTVPTETVQEPENGDILVSDAIMLTEFVGRVGCGKQYTVQIAAMPGGYSQADLIWTSDDPKVATVDARGVVTGISEGATVITVSTKDGKYSAYCAISVMTEDSGGAVGTGNHVGFSNEGGHGIWS